MVNVEALNAVLDQIQRHVHLFSTLSGANVTFVVKEACVDEFETVMKN